jgi:hypothetical protein
METNVDSVPAPDGSGMETNVDSVPAPAFACAALGSALDQATSAPMIVAPTAAPALPASSSSSTPG